MKKNYFITFFITTHIILIFLQIYKHTLFTAVSYNEQQCEKQIEALTKEKQTLEQNLYAMKNRENIKKEASARLNMRPYTLNQITKLQSS
jgi:cell division protein FtsL